MAVAHWRHGMALQNIIIKSLPDLDLHSRLKASLPTEEALAAFYLMVRRPNNHCRLSEVYMPKHGVHGIIKRKCPSKVWPQPTTPMYSHFLYTLPHLMALAAAEVSFELLYQ
eukprot:scaffold4081_cov34-Prasinocladus_malaysianus.AAC.1